MVQSITIPADNTTTLRISTLDSLEGYRRTVGGRIEAVDIPDLGVTMYVNEEGLIRDLPFDRRATFFRRFHVPHARDTRLIGDVAVLGLTEDEGENTELREDLRTAAVRGTRNGMRSSCERRTVRDPLSRRRLRLRRRVGEGAVQPASISSCILSSRSVSADRAEGKRSGCLSIACRW
jgi:hypothetical protein